MLDEAPAMERLRRLAAAEARPALRLPQLPSLGWLARKAHFKP